MQSETLHYDNYGCMSSHSIHEAVVWLAFAYIPARKSVVEAERWLSMSVVSLHQRPAAASELLPATSWVRHFLVRHTSVSPLLLTLQLQPQSGAVD